MYRTKRIVRFAAATGALAAMLLPFSAAAQREGSGYYHGPGMMWGDGMGGFGMMFGFIFMLIIIAALVAGTILILRQIGVGGSAHGMGGRNDALDILKQRYAKGEIDSKEFEERRRLLSE